MRFKQFYMLENAIADYLKERYIILDINSLQDELSGYRPFIGQRQSFHFPIRTLKGRTTRKYFHVIIEKLEGGIYEGIWYAN